jgi:hypothetical protein
VGPTLSLLPPLDSSRLSTTKHNVVCDQFS